MSRPLFFFLILAAALFSFDAAAAPVDLQAMLQQAEPGMWVRMKNPNGIETVTLATKKDAGTLTVEIHTFRKKKIQSWVEQVISISGKKVVRSRIMYPDGQIDEVPVENFEMALESYENYKEVGPEEVRVPAGTFRCRHFRTIVDDHLVHVWLSDQIPLTRMVKSTFQGGSLVLLEFGKGGIAPAFK